MNLGRRAFLAGFGATLVSGSEADADARRRRKRRKRAKLPAASFERGTTETGDCPCNGGRVCVGPRGGRYCITSGGNKRYGV
jgi:hypothetical protein